MTEHTITLPPDLRRLWFDEAQRKYPDNPSAWVEYIAEKSTQWGADQELEACCEWLVNKLTFREDGIRFAGELRAARRPKPPSEAEQALAELEEIMTELHDETGSAFTASTIRHALERLQQLEEKSYE